MGFGLAVIEPRAGLVPLTFTDALKEPLKALAGVSVDAVVRHGKTAFEEALLFTHRGLSGPAILQISSYWQPGDAIRVDLSPGLDGAAGDSETITGGGARALCSGTGCGVSD